MSEDIPDPWRSASERKGISPTYRPLAAAAGLSHETVRKVVQGRATSKRSMQKIADALGVTLEDIHAWRGEAPPDYGRDFEPDPVASLLTTEEREAVNGLIRLLTRSRSEQREEVVGNAEHPTPTRQAGQEPALGPGDVDLAASEIRTPDGLTAKQRAAAAQDAAAEGPQG